MNWNLRYTNVSPRKPDFFAEDLTKKVEHTYEPDDSASYTTWKLHEPVGKVHGVKVTQKREKIPDNEDVAYISTHYLDHSGRVLYEGPSGPIGFLTNRPLSYQDKFNGHHEMALTTAVKALHS